MRRLLVRDGGRREHLAAMLVHRLDVAFMTGSGSSPTARLPSFGANACLYRLGRRQPRWTHQVRGCAAICRSPRNHLPRIVRAASLQGFQLVGGEDAAHFKSETEVIGFSISELVKREKHVLTDAERTKEEAWQRKRDLAARRNAWDAVLLDRPQFPEWDYYPTGRLSFEFEQVYVFGGGTAPRRSFRDANIQRLETMASEIGVGLAVLAAAKTEQRLKREAEERRREEERRRRELAERAKHIEDRRIAGLGAILAELDELDRLRRLIGMLTTEVATEPTARLTTFLSWAQDHLAKREARVSAPAIEERFAAEHLFGDDDDHAFTPSRWY